ncbi:hypothetical protein PC116_g24958 [Phytophthora cactorum]|nr:hypothetical protein PC116_g24958 [Phytophthora cactorum]
MKFPLAHAPFGPLRLGEGDRKEAVELADVFVQQTLADYETHLEVQHGVVDEVRWKMVKRFEDVVVYQDRETMRPRRLTLASSSSGSGYEHRESPNEMQKLLCIPKKLHHMSPLTRTVMQTSVVVCTPCMRTVLTTSCLEAAQAEAERNNHAGGSIKDTSSPSSSASSHAW